MTYYICHQAKHVVLEKNCTKVPYSDTALYDSDCHPYPLVLVGLVEDKLPGERAQKWICDNDGHIAAGGGCTKTPATRSTISTSGSSHRWAPYYDVGEYVLIRGRIAGKDRAQHKSIAVAIKDAHGSHSIAVSKADILGRTPAPIPDEPDRKSLLKSKAGQLFGFTGGVWQVIGDEKFDTGLEWPDVWENYGPFDEFKPTGEIK
jgi:hypothetical protein